MTFRELTDIELAGAVAQRLGVRVQGVMASADDQDFNGQYALSVSGEVLSLSGGPLERPVAVQIVALNRAGQVVGVSELYLFDDFMGYQAFDQAMFCKGFPSCVKVIPRPA